MSRYSTILTTIILTLIAGIATACAPSYPPTQADQDYPFQSQENSATRPLDYSAAPPLVNSVAPPQSNYTNQQEQNSRSQSQQESAGAFDESSAYPTIQPGLSSQDPHPRPILQSTPPDRTALAPDSLHVPSRLTGFRQDVSEELTTADIEQLLAQINSELSTLGEDDARDATVQLTAASGFLKDKQRLIAEATASRASATTAAQLGREISAEIAELEKAKPEPVNMSLVLVEVQQEVARQELLVEQIKNQLKENNTVFSSRISRRQEIRDLLVKTAGDITMLESQLAAPVTDDTLPARARRYEMRSRLAMHRARTPALNAELDLMDTEDREDLVRLDGKRLGLMQTAAEKRLKQLEQLEGQKRQEQANLAMQAARDESEAVDPILRKSHEINIELADRSRKLVEEIEAVKVEYNTQHDRLDRTRRSYTEAISRVEEIGLSGSVGDMLRKQKGELPDVRFTRFNANQVKERIGKARFQLFDIKELDRDLDNSTIVAEIEGALAAQSPELNQQLSDATIEQLEEPIAKLVAARHKLLDDAHKLYTKLYDELVRLEAEDLALVVTTERFREFINERIFWIRSNDVLFSSLKIDEGDRRVMDPHQWLSTRDKIKNEVIDSPMLYILLASVVLGLFLLRPRFKMEVDALGVQAARGSCDTFWPTGRALLLTILTSLALPMIPLILGLRFRAVQNAMDGNLFAAIGTALLTMAWFVIPVEIFRRLCRPCGLAQMHFSWSDKVVSTLRRNLAWALPVGAAFTFAVSLIYSLGLEHRIDLIERSLFVVGMLALTYCLYRCFSPTYGMFSEYLRTRERSWAHQTSVIWFGAILMVPFSLAILTVWGFYYTALNLAACVYSTFVFAIVAETLRELLQRFILVRRRHVHIAANRRKREQQQERQREQLREQARKKDNQRKKKALMSAEKKSPTERLSVSPAAPTEPLLSETEAIARVAVKASEKTAEKGIAELTTANALLVSQSAEAMLDSGIDEVAKKAAKLISMCTILIWIVGLWLIWSDVLPALRALDNYVIWPAEPVHRTTAQVYPGTSGTVSADAGTSASSAKPETTNGTTESAAQSTPTAAPSMSGGMGMTSTSPEAVNTNPSSTGTTVVTIRDLLLFVMIAFVTLISARNFPSLLEMFFLEQLPVDHSVRNAVKSLTSYFIVMVGVIFAFRTLSIGWSQIQWLVTALTFGLAFGLQEIFANFVAGIILLFERPVRIGDQITVDEVTGVVSQIRTRATTIISWDRKEYIIPNKDFITGRLLNWTLSDKINRIVIDVGVGYGSDVEKAKELLYQVCANHPIIVQDPPTIVTFDKFGDNSLNFRIRTFLPDIESRLPVIDSLHTAINRAFTDAGIEISFPQRDLHIRSIDKSVLGMMGNRDAA